MQKVVIYAGRFQPMLRHHADVYAAIQRAFPDAEVYVATSDKTEPPKSPFNFSEKKSIITAHNIPADHVLKVTSPYSWQEYADKFDGTKTILIYAVGGKDADRFKFNLDKNSNLNLKKDGTVAHVQPIEALKEDPKPMTERSYVYLIPTLTSDSGEELSASKFREEIKNAPNLAAAKKLYTKQFGHYNEHVFSLIYSKLKGKSDMNEQIDIIRKLAGLAEAAPVHFGQDGDPAKAKFVPGSGSASEMSIANRFPEDADVNDPATKKEEFLKALVSTPAALLAEINGRLDPKDHNSLQVGERLNEIISQLESGKGSLTSLSADDKSFAVALAANAVKNMSLDRGDTGAAPEEEELKDSFNLDELRIRAGISQTDGSMSESEMEEAFSIKEGFEDAKAFAEERAIRAKNLKPYVGQTIFVWQEGHLNAPYETELRIDSVTNTSVVINGEKMPINGLNDFVNYNAADDYMWKNKEDADHYASIVDDEDDSDVNHDDDDHGDYDDYGSGPRTEEAEAFANAKAIRAKNLKPYVGQIIFAYSAVNGQPYRHEVDVDSVDSKQVGINGQFVTIDGMESIVTYIYDEPMWKNKSDAQEYIRLNNLDESRRLDRGDTGAAPEEENLKDNFNLDELRVRAGIQVGEGDADMAEGHGTDSDPEVEQILAKCGSGDLDAYEIMTRPTTPAEKEAAKIIQDMFDSVTEDHPLHGDDDFEEILEIVCNRLNDDYGPGMTESEHVTDDEDESVYYDDEDEGDDGIDWDEEEVADDEDEVDESQTFNEEKLPMVKLADIMADYGLTEASKPDFLDADKDGDKKEPMKKAIKDAEKKSHDKKDDPKESVEEHITNTSVNAVQQALSELRKLAGL